MNRLLHNAIPVLGHTGWEITKVEYGYCESVLPLNSETTNQHGTHQAALISLAADYTGGMALTSILTGVPLSGIHKCQPENAASLWLAAMNVKYLQPSTGHLTARCRIPDKLVDSISRRYFKGKRILATLTIMFESNGKTVAEAELKYFAQPTAQLLQNSGCRSTLFAQKIKASARMIAGVRASSGSTRIRVDCPLAKSAAGPHGVMLAKRLKKALPQLSDMVLARTRNIDETILEDPDVQQVVMLGAGLDMRPFRIYESAPNIKFYEVDLPEMLEERERVINQLKDVPPVKRQMVGADFLAGDLAKQIVENSDFDTALPTLFIYEGCSMYFTAAENREILTNVWLLAKNNESRLWADFVTLDVVEGKTERPEIESFLSQMDELGERFIFGSDDPVGFLKNCGFSSAKRCTSRESLETNESIFDVYQFCVANV